MMNLLIGLAALVVLVPYLDRLRVLDWRMHRWSVVSLHLAMALWLGYVAFVALIEQALSPLHAPIGMVGCLVAALWIFVSHKTWSAGPPDHTQTHPAPLTVNPKGHP